MRVSLLCLFFLSAVFIKANAQVEHVPVSHPVYEFLQRQQTRGFLKNHSLAVLPLQRSQVIEFLKLTRKNESELTEADRSTLLRFEKEFEILPRGNSVIFKSETDSTALFFDGLFTDAEKLVYRHRDSTVAVQVNLIGSLQQGFKKYPDSSAQAFIAIGGLRIFGTIEDLLGFYLQATNGSVSGDKTLGFDDAHIRHSLKFTELNSDMDLVESHVRFQKDWFYALISRETMLAGAGYNFRMIISDNAPPIDALSAGVRFDNFEYRFTHGSLVGIAADSLRKTGIASVIPSKYLVMHRAAFRQDWGEVALWESVIYSHRSVDLAYLNPLTFLKSVEHSLRDRDNSAMGADATVRPFKNLELRGSFFLDDIIFSEIGNDFWGNKTAWNIGAMTTLGPFDVITEYARVNPYTFSHYSRDNSTTNDGVLLAGDLRPNSDRLLLKTNWWWGNRYPVTLTASFTRHGANEYDAAGKLVKNVGGDVLQTIRYEFDSLRAPFLDGDRSGDVFALEAFAGWEIIRGFALQGYYRLESFKEMNQIHTFRLTFRYEDF